MGPNKQQHNKKNLLRYKTETRPGLVALYDIRPGNGAGPFLQPGARTGQALRVRQHAHPILTLTYMQSSVPSSATFIQHINISICR